MTSTYDSENPDQDLDSLPTANIEKRRGLLQSKFWILTALALLLAIGLAWWSMPKSGTRVLIHFPDGHGLHEGDPVRYRGINVGVVRDIHLSDRDGVDVSVGMNASAGRLLKEGTRFWIVRPQLALTGVSGLETAVGPKYIAVEPDESNENSKQVTYFEGLADPPATLRRGDGVEIVLRADKQFSVRPGSAVTYRGFEVGKILDVRLSDDARHVDLRAVVDRPYQRLVTSKSKFWVNSGVDVDFSLRGGLTLDSESLETIARGGVSFLTIGTGGLEVAPGQVFTLHKQPDDQWVKQASNVRLATVKLKGSVTIVIKTTRNGLLGKRKLTRLASAVPLRLAAGKYGLVVPVNILQEFAGQKPPATEVSIDGFSSNRLDEILFDQLVELAKSTGSTEYSLRAMMVPLGKEANLPWQKFATAENVGHVVAVRRPVSAKGDLFVHQPISAEQLTETSEGVLEVSNFEGDVDLWNGSPILSGDSGEVIGVLTAERDSIVITPSNQLLARPNK